MCVCVCVCVCVCLCVCEWVMFSILFYKMFILDLWFFYNTNENYNQLKSMCIQKPKPSFATESYTYFIQQVG